MPDVVDLLETCVDDIMRTPVPMATTGASEEAGPSAAASTPTTGVENLSLADAAARLKQLAIESTPTSAPALSNINVNMNNQEEVLKLTEKSLSSVSSSPVLSQLKAPDELKSNILKAQAEAVLRGTREEIGGTGEKNCNLQEAATRLKGRQGQTGSTSSLTSASREAPMQTCSSSLEVGADESFSSSSSVPVEPVTEAPSPKDKTEEREVHKVDNLIDFTDPTPAQVQPPKPIITPRWIIPAAPQTGTFTNGLLELDKVKTAAQHSTGAGAPAPLPRLSHTHNVIATSIVAHPPRNNHRPRGLLTTEL